MFIFSVLFIQFEEERLYSLYLQAPESGEWGPYDTLTPTQKLCVVKEVLEGAVWVSNGLFLVWSVLYLGGGGGGGGGMWFNNSCFSGPEAYTSSVFRLVL